MNSENKENEFLENSSAGAPVEASEALAEEAVAANKAEAATETEEAPEESKAQEETAADGDFSKFDDEAEAKKEQEARDKKAEEDKELPPDPDAILEVRHLKKYFVLSKTISGKPKSVLRAVDDVSFKLKAGETIGIVGESGCGKSTLGRTLVKLLEPTEGQILFEGEDITYARGVQLKRLRTRIQMIFQDPFSSLNPRKTVRESILEPLKLNSALSARQREEQVLELMNTVGLAQRLAHSYPHELDGGRRQRIGIARALALNPAFIVCDEPVSALDVSIQAQILNLMQDVQEDQHLAYLFITHDLSVVRHMANQILVMYLGQMVELTSADVLFERQMHPYTQALLSAIPVPSLEKRRQRIILRGEITSPINPPAGCRFAPRCPYVTERCTAQTPELYEAAPGHFVACHRVGEVG